MGIISGLGRVYLGILFVIIAFGVIFGVVDNFSFGESDVCLYFGVSFTNNTTEIFSDIFLQKFHIEHTIVLQNLRVFIHTHSFTRKRMDAHYQR